MTSIADVTVYRAIAEKLPSEAFLGQIVMTTVRDVDVEHERLKQLAVDADLTRVAIQARLFPADAFKRAAAELATTFRRKGDRKSAVLVRPAGQDETFIYRNIVLERATYTGEKRSALEYYTLATVSWNRADDVVVVARYADAVPDGFDLEEAEWVSRHLGNDGAHLKARHEHWKTHVDPDRIRTYVRAYLVAMDGFPMKRSGSIYFVPQEVIAELNRLSKLIGEIGSTMHLVPLLDIAGQRELLAETFTDNAVRDATALMAEIGKVLNEPGAEISDRVYESYVARAGEMFARARKYSTMLDEQLDTADTQVKLLVEQLAELSDRLAA